MNKVCNKCGKTKSIEEFSKYKVNGKEYYRSQCKICRCDYSKNYYKKNKESELKRSKNYVRNNEDKIKEYKKQYYLKNKGKKKLTKEQEEHYIQWRKKYRQKNKPRIDAYMSEYRKNNKDKMNEQKKIYNRRRKQEDPLYAFKIIVRATILNSFKRRKNKKPKHTEEILGCKINEFVEHLLQTFKNKYGYEWDGIEKVHIDHIKPLKLAETEEDVIKLCHYTNLQLLKAKDNLKKSCKYEVDDEDNNNISNNNNDNESDTTDIRTDKTEENNTN